MGAQVTKSVFAPHLNRHVKFGRKRPVAIGPHLKLRNYLRANLPAPPSSCDFTPAAETSLRNVYLNDQLGDCVIAGANHIAGVETGNAGSVWVASDAQITADYSAVGGYVPGNPSTDNGCNLQDALNYYTSHGFANGTKLLGWLAVDATNQQEVMTACYLFENLYFGIELPDAWINPFPSGDGFIWDVGTPDPENGHCVIGAGFGGSGYTSSGVKIDTWGIFGCLTFAAIAKLCTGPSNGELYVMLSPDQLTKGQAKAPNGVAWTDLLADFDSMGGTVPLPSPQPAPAPPAPAPGPATLANAQAWVTSAFQQGHAILPRDQAVSVASGALASNWPTS
jgi:hypothetical protein